MKHINTTLKLTILKDDEDKLEIDLGDTSSITVYTDGKIVLRDIGIAYYECNMHNYKRHNDYRLALFYWEVHYDRIIKNGNKDPYCMVDAIVMILKTFIPEDQYTLGMRQVIEDNWNKFIKGKVISNENTYRKKKTRR